MKLATTVIAALVTASVLIGALKVNQVLSDDYNNTKVMLKVVSAYNSRNFTAIY
jgi:hypothetical protein